MSTTCVTIIVSPSVGTELGVDLMEVAGIDKAQAPVLAQSHGPCLESVNFKASETAQPCRQHA